MATKVQLKRSTVSGRAPNTTSSGNSTYIAAGELAINLTDGKLFSSNGTALITVGSNLDSLSANSIALTGRITANSSNGTSGQVLTSGGTGNVYWSTIGGGSVLTVSNYTANAYVNAISNVSQIAFNTSTGISVQDLGSGVGLVSLGSSFKTWNVAGQTSLVAVGEDTVRFIAGNNVTITTNATSIPQQIRFDVTSSGGGANVALTANTSDTQTFYFPMSNATSGSWSNAVMDTTDLYYVPSTGRFSVPSISLTGNVYTPSTGAGLVGGVTGTGGPGYVGSFNGSSQYLTTPANTALTPTNSTTPMTIEAWIYPQSYTSGFIVCNTFPGGGAIPYALYLGPSAGDVSAVGTVVFATYSGSSWSGCVTTSTVTLNAWTHVAAVFDGTNMRIYLNGVQAATVAQTLNTGGTNQVYIGKRWDAAENFNGYISNVRIVKGVAVYTGAFTAPTGPLTVTASANPFGGSNTAAITGTATSLLTLQNSTIIDNSTYGLTITNNGTVTTAQQTVPFGSGTNIGTFLYDGTTWQSTALAINGTLSITGNTVAAQVNATSINVSGATTVNGALTVNNTAAVGNVTVTGFINVSSYGSFGGVVNATSFNSTGTATSTFANNVTITGVTNTVSFNQTGATTSTFANNVTITGVANVTTINVGANVALSTTKLSVGNSTVNVSASTNGSISLTGNVYTPSTGAGLVGGVSGAPYVGYFDGSSYPSVSSTTAFNLTGDFTLEAFVYPTYRSSGDWGILDARVNGGSATSYVFSIANGKIQFYTGSSNIGTGTVPLNTWSHIAVVRSGSALNYYINGVLDTARPSFGTFSISPGTTSALIGSKDNGLGASYSTQGRISNLRVVVGTAVYTGDFTTPTGTLNSTQLANPYGGSNTAAITGTATKLLTLQNSTLIDNSSYGLSITANGVTMSQFSPPPFASASQGTFLYDGATWQSTPLTVTGAFGANNTTVTGTLTTTGNTVAAQVNATSINVGANVAISTSQLSVGNSTINAVVTQTGTTWSNSTATMVANTAGMRVGNSTVNTSITSTAITSPATLAIGNTTVTGFANISSTLQVTGSATFTDVTISGNLTTSGTTTYINTTNLNVGDNIITLNADLTGATAPTENAGIEINRGSSANVALRWNETSDVWQFTTDGTTYSTIGTSTDASTAYTNATAFAANASNISGGTLSTARLPATANISTAINVGANVNLSTTTIAVGNSTVNVSASTNGSISLTGNVYTLSNNAGLVGGTIVSANIGGIVADAAYNSEGWTTGTDYTAGGTGAWVFSSAVIQGASGGARSAALTSGKYYFEVTVSSGGGNYWLAGMAKDSVSGYNNVPSWFSAGGAYGGLTGGTSLGNFTNGSTIMIAYDTTVNQFWIGKNGTWYIAPTSTGTTIPGTGSTRFMIMAGSSSQTASGIFKQSSPTYTVPSGFSYLTASQASNALGTIIYDGVTWQSTALTVNGAFSVGNSTVSTTINATSVSGNAAFTIGNTTINGTLTTTGNTVAAQVNATSINVGANVIISTSQLSVGNTTSNAVVTQTGTTWSNSTATMVANTTGMRVGNSTVNTVITSTAITSPATLAIGNTTVTGFANISSTLQVTGNATFTDVTITGNLTTSGTTTYINTTNLNVGDNIITLNADVPGATAPTENAGIEINRGSAANVALRWNETSDVWQFTNDGTTYSTIGTSADASTAYTNATAFAANATNISSGTLSTARLPATANISTAINVGANVNLSTTTIAVGNSTQNTSITSNNITLNGTFTANSSNGTSGQMLTSSGTGNVYWSTVSAGATLVANTSDTQTYYIPMSNATSGSWSNAVVDSTDLYYVPSTGMFSVPTVSLTGNVYTTANNTGLVSGTDQAYVGTFNNSNYLEIVANGLMDQSGPFTMEGWFYPTTWSNWMFGYDNYQTYGVRIDVSTGNRFILHRHYSGDLATSTSNNFSTNTWYHVALSSNGSTTQLYVNGSLQINVAGGGYDANSSLRIGGDGTGRFQGKISNFRFVGGTQVYTGNFTTPTGPLTAVASANPFGGSNTAAVTGTATKLLTLQNSTLIDNSSYAVTIANSGAVSTSLQSVPFPNQGRLIFDSNTWQSTALTVTNNITLNGSLTANSSNGTSGQVLTSSGTGSVYWSTVSGGGGSGATIVANSTSTQTFYFPMSNTTSGSWSNAVVDSTDLFYVPSTNLLTVPSANITTSLTVPSANITTSLTTPSANITTSLTTPSANITTSLNVVGTVTVNGAFAVNNTTAVGNSTVTGFINTSSYGTFGGVVNATSFNSTGTATSTFANNVTVTGTVNATSLSANAISANGITVVGKVTANAVTGTAGQVLTSGGAAGNVYWSTISGGGGGGGTYSGPGITSSATAPATPAEGDFWYITDLKILTVYTLEAGQYFWLDITGRTIAGTIENPFLSNDIMFPAIFPSIPPLLLMAAYD